MCADRGARCELGALCWPFRSQVRGAAAHTHQVRGSRYQVRSSRYEVRGSRYHVRGSRYQVRSSGVSRQLDF